MSVQIHAAPVSAPVRIQENIPGELFMYWFRARGYFPWGFACTRTKILREISLHVPLCVSSVEKQQLRLHKEALREFFSLPGYNNNDCNHMNDSSADYLRAHFVDHHGPWYTKRKKPCG